MDKHVDSGDYTYQQPSFDPRPWPERADARLAELERRVRQLESTVHRLLNPVEEENGE